MTYVKKDDKLYYSVKSSSDDNNAEFTKILYLLIYY
jgi:hypothetical protein